MRAPAARRGACDGDAEGCACRRSRTCECCERQVRTLRAFNSCSAVETLLRTSPLNRLHARTASESRRTELCPYSCWRGHPPRPPAKATRQERGLNCHRGRTQQPAALNGPPGKPLLTCRQTAMRGCANTPCGRRAGAARGTHTRQQCATHADPSHCVI